MRIAVVCFITAATGFFAMAGLFTAAMAFAMAGLFAMVMVFAAVACAMAGLFAAVVFLFTATGVFTAAVLFLLTAVILFMVILAASFCTVALCADLAVLVCVLPTLSGNLSALVGIFSALAADLPAGFRLLLESGLASLVGIVVCVIDCDMNGKPIFIMLEYNAVFLRPRSLF